MAEPDAANLLVVDDEPLIRWSLQNDLSLAGYTVRAVGSGEEALNEIEQQEPDLVILDNKMPGMSGQELIEILQQRETNCVIIMLSALDGLEHAVAAVRAGAYDYVAKPFDLDDILVRIEKALRHRSLQSEVASHRSVQSQRDGLDDIVAVSPVMQEVIQTLMQIASHGSSTVLLRGETGVGKDLMAKAIHRLSPRSGKPFVEINCPSFPSPLLESELFGHERGAYTDARTTKRGLLELANQGTLFLNEIAEINPVVQTKLLQFLEHKVFRRVGGTQERTIDARIITATNQPLEEAVERGLFRQDLYYRLNVIPIHIPPLRKRPEDIPVLIEHFLELFRNEFSKSQLEIETHALERLNAYPWPGNVRELKNTLERMVLLTKNSVIHESGLPEAIFQSAARPSGSAASSPLVEQEKRMILEALNEAEWNQSLAARQLRISRDTLRYRIKKYGIQTSQPPSVDQ